MITWFKTFDHTHSEEVFLSLSCVWWPWLSFFMLCFFYSWHFLQSVLGRLWLHLLHRCPWSNKETSETLMSLLFSRPIKLKSISFSHYVLQPAKCSGGFTLQFFNIFGSKKVSFSHFFFSWEQERLIVPMRWCLGSFSATSSVWVCDKQQTSSDYSCVDKLILT